MLQKKKTLCNKRIDKALNVQKMRRYVPTNAAHATTSECNSESPGSVSPMWALWCSLNPPMPRQDVSGNDFRLFLQMKHVQQRRNATWCRQGRCHPCWPCGVPRSWSGTTSCAHGGGGARLDCSPMPRQDVLDDDFLNPLIWHRDPTRQLAQDILPAAVAPTTLEELNFHAEQQPRL